MGLILPKHMEDALKAEDAAKKSGAAFVDPKDRVLDPALLKMDLLSRLPQPTGWRILVMPYQGRRTTKGGVEILDSTREREQLATVVAYVLKVGPMAYGSDKFGDDVQPWCQEGDWVCIGRYSGSRFKIDGGEVRIINDDEVIATLEDPDDIRHI